jgi:chorismate mutase
LGLKAKTYGTDPAFPSETGPKINVDAVVAMYKVSGRLTALKNEQF